MIEKTIFPREEKAEVLFDKILSDKWAYNKLFQTFCDNLFDRFETQGDYASFQTGIGLNLSRLVVEAHSGTIQAYNRQDGQGAVFRVVLPQFALKQGKI